MRQHLPPPWAPPAPHPAGPLPPVKCQVDGHKRWCRAPFVAVAVKLPSPVSLEPNRGCAGIKQGELKLSRIFILIFMLSFALTTSPEYAKYVSSSLAMVRPCLALGNLQNGARREVLCVCILFRNFCGRLCPFCRAAMLKWAPASIAASSSDRGWGWSDSLHPVLCGFRVAAIWLAALQSFLSGI
jgi:hypothetical protein